MEVKMSAIDVLTLQTIAKRARGHFDGLVSTLKNGRSVLNVRGYGYNDKLKNFINPAYDIDLMKQWSDELEDDLRSIKSAMTQHNAMTKVSFHDARTEDVKEVSIFEAFNTLKDLEGDLNRAHAELNDGVLFVGEKDTPEEDFDFLKREDHETLEEGYLNLLSTILSIKRGIAKANNKTVKVDLKCDYLLDVAGVRP